MSNFKLEQKNFVNVLWSTLKTKNKKRQFEDCLFMSCLLEAIIYVDRAR